MSLAYNLKTNGMIYDDNLNQCVSNSSSCSKSKTESFMNNIFTKKNCLYQKPDVTLYNNVMPSNYW